MEMPTNEHRLMRLWSDELPEADRFPVWRQLVTERLLQSEVRRLSADPFQALVYLRSLPTMRFGWGLVGASQYDRTRQIVAADNNDLVLLMNLEGSFSVSQFGNTVNLAPGDAILASCSEVATFHRPTVGKLLCIRLGFDTIASAVRNVHDASGRLIPHNTEGLRLLAGYIRLLNETDPLTSGKAQSLVTNHVRDLLALTLGTLTQDGNEAEGLRAARLGAIKTYIGKNASQPNLLAEEVANRFKISERNLQRLFQNEGTTFSGYLLAQRLAQAYELLGDPKHDRRKIGDIAFSCGFGDLSHFNRNFRRRYGNSPAEVRHSAILKV